MLHGLGVAPKASSRSTPSWRRWMVAAGLLALGLLAFAWRQPLLQSIPKPPSLASKVGGGEVATATPRAPVAPAASAAAPAMVEHAAAAVIESPAAWPASQAQQIPVRPAPAPVPAMPASTALTAPAPAVVARSEPRPPLVQRSPALAVRPAPPASPPPAARAPTPPAAGRDPDVDLVAALMAHVAGGPAPASKGSAAASPPKPMAAAPAVTQGTIDHRVQRCKASHPDDREASRACRRRVCEGYWGRYPACPVRLMPRAATTA